MRADTGAEVYFAVDGGDAYRRRLGDREDWVEWGIDNA